MPLYDYRCRRCGDFRAFRPMAESARELPCPRCTEASGRALTAPMLSGASSGWLAGSRPGAGPQRGGWRHACGFGCNHSSC